MAKIMVNVTLEKTVTQLDGATFDAVIQWINTNIVKPLPADTELKVSLTCTR